MIDLNVPNVITVGVISVAAVALATIVSKKMGFSLAWA